MGRRIVGIAAMNLNLIIQPLSADGMMLCMPKLAHRHVGECFDSQPVGDCRGPAIAAFG